MVKRTGITRSGLKYVEKMIDNAINEEQVTHRYCTAHMGDFHSTELTIPDEDDTKQQFAYQRWDPLTAVPRRFKLQIIPAVANLDPTYDDLEGALNPNARNVNSIPANAFGTAENIGEMRIGETIELSACKIKMDFRLKPLTTNQTVSESGINFDVVIEYKIISVDPNKINQEDSTGGQIDQGAKYDPLQCSDIFVGLSQNGGITKYMKTNKPKHDYTVVRERTIILNSPYGLIEEKPNDNGFRVVTTQVARKSCVETFKYGQGRKKTYPWKVKAVEPDNTLTDQINLEGEIQQGKNMYLYVRAYFLDPQYNAQQAFEPLGVNDTSPVQCRITEICYYRDDDEFNTSQAIANVNN